MQVANMGLKGGGIVFYENKVYGCLLSVENMVQTFMNMMQNPCQKHALNHPYVVSRREG